MRARTPLPKSDEEIIRKIDEILKDPERFEEWMASRMDRAVKNWRKH
jgi:hypothetical protein